MAYSACDRVLRVEPGVGAAAIKNVTFSEDYLGTHFPVFPVMPAAMMVDAVAEVCAHALEGRTGGLATFLVSVSGAKFRRFVRPGDALVVEVRVTNCDAAKRRAAFSAQITVDGERTATLREVVVGWETATAETGR